MPVLGTFHVTLTDIYLEGLDVEEARTGLTLGSDGAFTLHVEDLQVYCLAKLPRLSPPEFALQPNIVLFPILN